MGFQQKGESFYRAKAGRKQNDKVAVALWLVSQLCEGDSLLIDAGTSLTPIAQIITLLAEKDPERTHYTIMTHNYGAFDCLTDAEAAAHLNVFLTGGRYDEDLQALFGDQAQTAYAEYYPRWVLVGQNGLDANVGLFCHGNTEELALKTQIFEKPTDKRVVVSDWTKIGSMGGLCFGPIEGLGLNALSCEVVTTAPPPGEEASRREQFEAQCGLLDEIDGVSVKRIDYECTEQGTTEPTIATNIDRDIRIEDWSVTIATGTDEKAGLPILSGLQVGGVS